jgi:hypothetical protein
MKMGPSGVKIDKLVFVDVKAPFLKQLVYTNYRSVKGQLTNWLKSHIRRIVYDIMTR